MTHRALRDRGQVHRALRDRGQATVELALVLPVVMMLVLLAVQVALIARAQVLVTHAAREGARAVAVEHDSAAATRAVFASNGLDPSRTSVAVSGADGAQVGVEVVHRAATDVPLIGSLLGDVTLTAAATMRAEPR